MIGRIWNPPLRVLFSLWHNICHSKFLVKQSMRVDSNKVNAGLYIHIPFCIKKCPYCDFFSTTNLSLEDQFTNSIELEIKRIAQKKLVFDTIYFGGGTPSVFKSINIGKIINAAHINLNILSNAEITIEINPGTVNLQKLIDYRSFGINRINIGVQSFNDKELGFLGRIHSAQDAVYAIEKSRKVGFSCRQNFTYGRW